MGVEQQLPNGVIIRPARWQDLAGIARVKALTWPQEPVREDCIAAVLASTGHATLAAELAGEVVGFISSFATNGLQGLRWEVDLLAVAPGQRGLGLGSRLVALSCEQARQKVVCTCRALVQVNNTASQRCFEQNGFHCDAEPGRLMVSTQPYDGEPMPGAAGRRVCVLTMNYRGAWLEEHFAPPDLLAARSCIATGGVEVAGAVISSSDLLARREAERLGYSLLGEYHWWRKELS